MTSDLVLTNPETRDKRRETHVLSERIEAFHQRTLTAGIDGHSAKRKIARRCLPQLFGKSEEISWLISLERDDVFLLAKAEGMRHMDADIREFLPDHEVLFDQRVALVRRHSVPLPVLRTWIKKMVFLLARKHMVPVFGTIGHEHALLCYRKVIVRRLQIVAEVCAIEFGRHLLNEVELRSDPPEHKIGLRIKTYERIAEEQKAFFKFFVGALEFALEYPLGLVVQFSPFRIHAKEHEADKLFVDRRRLLCIFLLGDQAQTALFGDLFLGIRTIHLSF